MIFFSTDSTNSNLSIYHECMGLSLGGVVSMPRNKEQLCELKCFFSSWHVAGLSLEGTHLNAEVSQ